MALPCKTQPGLIEFTFDGLGKSIVRSVSKELNFTLLLQGDLLRTCLSRSRVVLSHPVILSGARRGESKNLIGVSNPKLSAV